MESCGIESSETAVRAFGREPIPGQIGQRFVERGEEVFGQHGLSKGR
jgi:hypothetical protein